jgi:hypothetical protein
VKDYIIEHASHVTMAEPITTTHIYKTVDGLDLTIDVSAPATAQDNGVALIHFHGGFLVSWPHC